jgi:hypothetical protein
LVKVLVLLYFPQVLWHLPHLPEMYLEHLVHLSLLEDLVAKTLEIPSLLEHL